MKCAFLTVAALIGFILPLSAVPSAHDQPVSDKEIVVEEAYIYGFPLVVMDITKDVMTATSKVAESQGPINLLFSLKTFPDPSFKDVVSPNADTLYTQAWLDVSKEPVILSTPDMGKRYYLFPMLDLWTNVFFSPGTRTTGNGKNNFAITGPDWKGTLPSGVQQVKAPTNSIWIIGRIQTDGPSDYAAVNKLQEQFKLTPLSVWGTNDVPPRIAGARDVDVSTPPIQQTLKMDGVAFFTRLAQLLKETPIPSADKEYVKKFSMIGLEPGKEFDVEKLSNEEIKELNRSARIAQAKVKEEWEKHSFASNENGWGVILKNIGLYGTNYLLRASVAYGGLGANVPQDAVYPATNVDDSGKPLTGQSLYVIHFNRGELPPVGAFWSITMYDDQQFFVANPINRYAIGDRSDLQFNADGSLDIFIQNKSPGKQRESNWLPAPSGPFNLIMRLYAPKEAVLNGSWKPPRVQRVQ
ncbi:conserved putative secreted protein [Candidatus Protochlamydia naegleriophila]|uniref:Conserved putative secreted protein n=1 Tax=Candidatus Protochlamydia naegleriophila TaxID=389348 RepID=A0A0U5JH26_9BACT|nr:DUF1254 domain-containing protein [Candidatus Protochlamydia naegleriophila]CUI17253.1 conserved putative secreted protein [Candidatus Protochlamydia naegleriophila]